MKKITALITAVMFLFCVSVAFADEQMNFTYADYAGPFTDDGLAVYRARNGLYGFVNTEEKIAIPATYTEAYDFSESFAVVCKNASYGFINTQGELVVDCIWDDARSFSEGLAAVEKDKLWGFINTQGELVVDCTWTNVQNFSESLAAVEKDGKWGCIDATGAIVIDTIYDRIDNCQDGYIFVEDENNKEYYIDKTGAVISHKCEEVFSVTRHNADNYYEHELWANGHVIAETSLYKYFLEGFSVHSNQLVENTESLWIVKKSSKTMYEEYPVNSYLLYDSVTDQVLMQDMQFIDKLISDGLIVVRDDECAFYVNEQGVMEISPIGDNAYAFVDGVARVEFEGKYFFINVKGEIISEIYDMAHDMNNGFTTVKQDGKWFVINSEMTKVK